MTAEVKTRHHHRPSRGIRVDRVGDSLLVSVGRVRRSEYRLARALQPESGRIAVLMTHADATLMPRLAEELARFVPFVWDSVRLVSARAACAEGEGRPAAQVLSDLLSVEVLAPDGRLLSVPGGRVFVRAERDNPDSGLWWRFRPGRPPEASGRRFPTPEWERDLALFKDPGIPGVVVEEVPAGLWVHWPGQTRSKDLAFALSVQDSTMALLVSRAGDPPLRTADVTALIEAMPEELHERLTVVPYGDQPVSGARLGEAVSLAANRTLRLRTGMPLYVKGGGAQVVAVAPSGVPTWRPFARELAWRPHGGSRVLSWITPDDQLLPAGQAQLLLNDRWLVEVIEAGLWVREVDRLDGAGLVRHLPVSSAYCTVVVGADADSPHGPPWRTIVRLLRRLPHDARSRLRLVVPRGGGPRLLRGATRACRWVLDNGPVCVLTADGKLVRMSGSRREDTDLHPVRRSGPTVPAGWDDGDDGWVPLDRPRRAGRDRRTNVPMAPPERGPWPGGDSGRRPEPLPDRNVAERGDAGEELLPARGRQTESRPVVAVPDLVVSEERDEAGDAVMDGGERLARWPDDGRTDGRADSNSR